MIRDFLLGFIKIHVLHHAAEEPVYGLAMIEELARHGYAIGPGTLYPLLHALEAEGLLRREDRTVEGRVRKYYRATAAGRRALAEVRPKIMELVEEVVEGKGDRLDTPARRVKKRTPTRRPRRPRRPR
jgi:DNA-binding PadR family transcriptional regulator